MSFEEANELYYKSQRDIYKYSDISDKVHEAFVGGQPRKICYNCTHRNACGWQSHDTGLAGCNFYEKV